MIIYDYKIGKKLTIGENLTSDHFPGSMDYMNIQLQNMTSPNTFDVALSDKKNWNWLTR